MPLVTVNAIRCPKCSAWTTVLQTRKEYRQRECANLHRFWTVEQVCTDEAQRIKTVNQQKTKKKIQA